jgi:hypothetical protein
MLKKKDNITTTTITITITITISYIYMNQIYRWEHTYTKIYNYIEFLSCYTLISSKKKRTLSQFPPQNKHQKKIREKRVRLRMMTQQTR